MQRLRANGKQIPKEVHAANRKQRAMDNAAAVLTILIALSLFAVVAAAVSRFGIKADLTVNQIFQITETTKNVLNELEQPVEITYCNTKNDADSNVREILNRYDAASDYVEVTYLNLDANPAFAEEWSKKDINLSKDGVLVTSGEFARFIEWSELYAIKTYTDDSGSTQYSLSGIQAEAKLTSAIVGVVSDVKTAITFTTGHGENIPDTLIQVIENSNCTVEKTVLGVQKLNNTCQTMIIAGARRDFSENEIHVLNEFMSKGGNLLVFRDPEIEVLPNLDGFLQSWGFILGNKIVLEPSQQMGGPQNIIPNFGLSMISVYFSDNASYIVLPEVRAIRAENTNGCITNTVLRSTSNSYGKDYQSMTTLSQQAGDEKGPYTVAATSERVYRNDQNEEQTQYVFLTACTGFYQDEYLKMDSIANSKLILQVIAYMNGTETVLNIPAKTLNAGNIAISHEMTTIFAVLFVGVLPVALLTAGGYVFLKRRHT